MSNIISKITANFTSIPNLNPPKSNSSQTPNLQINNNIDTTETENLYPTSDSQKDNTTQIETIYDREKDGSLSSSGIDEDILSVIDNNIPRNVITKITTDSNYIRVTTYFNTELVFDKNNMTFLDVLDDNGISMVKEIDMYSEEADEYGLYGGNQESLITNNISYMRDKVIKSIIEKYYPLPPNKIEYEPEKLINVFKKMNETGCGYVTAANTIFNATMNLTDEEFYNKFGFDRYSVRHTYDGNYVRTYNYDYMFLDFFLYYQTNYYNPTEHAIEYEKINSSIEYIYGYIEDTEGMRYVGADGTYAPTVANVVIDYLKEKEMDINHINIFYESLFNESYYQFVQEKMNEEGATLVIDIRDFNMYAIEDLDGNGLLDDIMYSNVGGHAMVVTEITEDGDFIVSSWGNKYIIRPQTEGFLQESVIYYK